MQIDPYVQWLLARAAGSWYAPHVEDIRAAIHGAPHPGELYDRLTVILEAEGSPGARELQMCICSSVSGPGDRVPEGWPAENSPVRRAWRAQYAAQRAARAPERR